MCAPLVPLLATGIGAIGTGISTAAAIGQARVQAAAAQDNAAVESNAAAIGQQSMRDAALAQYRQMAAGQSQARLRAAASGDAVDFGTAGEAQADSQITGQTNLAQIYAQGNQQLMSADANVAEDLGKASIANSRADLALAGGVYNIGSGLTGGGGFGTTLGSARQYSPFKAGLGL